MKDPLDILEIVDRVNMQIGRIRLAALAVVGLQGNVAEMRDVGPIQTLLLDIVDELESEAQQLWPDALRADGDETEGHALA